MTGGTSNMDDIYNTIAIALKPHDLVLRGGFAATAGDSVPEVAAGQPALTVLMIGNTGHAMWDAFEASRTPGPNPLDRWTRHVIAPLAAHAGAHAVYPFDAPPLPFQRWAARAWSLHPSPLGLLIDAKFGLWYALRAALLFPVALDLPQAVLRVSPCDTCTTKPCKTACPIDAFSTSGFDYVSCRQYLATASGDDCLNRGCKARAACPVGAEHRYSMAQLRHHQRSFSGVVPANHE